MPRKKKEKKEDNKSPEPQLDDAPAAPWQRPTAEEKKQAQPVQRALKEAVAKVDSPEKAEEVVEDLEVAAAGKTVTEVEQTQPAVESPAQAAHRVKKKVESTPTAQKTEKALQETAKVVVTAEGREREILSEAAQEAMNPEQQGVAPAAERQRGYLRDAVLKRLKPLDALDAKLFLAINHLPHTRFLNGFFYTITTLFNVVAPWYGEMGIAMLRNRREVRHVFRESILPLLLTTSLVEFIVKPYFRRRRPFIAIIQAIVIGRKPGTWSFPSGHAAAAFAGAWLLNHQRPRFGLLRYFVASLVGFSRVYLGDHYPGDVASGSLIGLLCAEFFHRLLKHRSRKRR